MTEGAAAIYIALATNLVVWATIAIYLGRVHRRLHQIHHDLASYRNDDTVVGIKE